MGGEGGTCVCVVKKLSGGVIYWGVETQLAPKNLWRSLCRENGQLTIGGILYF